MLTQNPLKNHSMAKISIQKKHSKPEQEIEALVSSLQSELAQGYGCRCRRRGNELEIKRSGVTGTLRLYERQIDVDIVLGALMAMLAPKIESFIKTKLDEHLD
jgi:putative polyhydroxyalkanoate system protein